MRRVQHGKRKECNMNATWKKCNTEKVQHGKSATRKSATCKKCNTENVEHAKSATWKKYNMKIAEA